ncbi:HAD-IB family hydrolase [Demequina sp. B12]|uniref:HAD family hydrolase n=1 Tax=Demequina sp. B12 TaxID=2992757 RepID=UPI00237B1425|nr:HAD family hydrolase [Demequina sp. B12]MDE0572324.1 HAD-IB family hydrolase [Demequina sp. B12]
MSDRPQTNATVAAFFDVDNTVIRGASAYHIARGLQQHGFFRKRDVFRFFWEQLKYTVMGENREQIEGLRDEGLSIIKGWSVAEMIAVGEEVYDEILALRIFPGTRALIDEHLAAGREVWFVTTTPQEVGSVIAQRLGATGALGSRAEHVDGHYTGRLDGQLLHREAKAIAVAALAQERGLDLSNSYAYGDSINDGPMLESVGNPCAINPDNKLRRRAAERGWEVKEFRKRRKNGRRGIVRASAAGAVWATVAVARGVKSAGKATVNRVTRRPIAVKDDERSHGL